MSADGTVTGTGTKWQSSLSLIRPGATIMFLSSPIQMAVVNKVVSDTEIKAITTKGAVVASTDYAILLSDSLTVDGLAQDVAETLRYYQSQETVIADAVEFFNNFNFDSLQNLANQIKADSESAGASAAAASESESAAKTSETNAKASEVAAETARDQVQQIIDNAGEQSTLAVLAQPDGYKNIGGLDSNYANIGNAREQWKRQMADAGLNLVAGSFEEGATVQNATDAVWHISGGQCYTFSGELPKTVTAGSVPDAEFIEAGVIDDIDVGGGKSSLFDRLDQRGQYDLFQGFGDPRGVAGITFGGKRNKGTITVDQRGRLQVYSVKDGILTASRVAIPFTEGYGYGSNSKLGTITRFPVAGAEDDSQNSSLILLPQDDGSVKGYLAGPGLYTAYAVPESNAVKSVGKEIATIDQLPEALIYSSSNPQTWLGTSSWVKLVTVNNSQSGSVFSGLYSAGGGLSEAVGTYLIEMFSPSTNITTINSANLKTFVRITALRSRGDFRYPSGLCSFGIVVDSTTGTTTLYAKLSNRSENSTLVPLRTTPDSSNGVFRVKIWNDKDSYVTVEPSGIIYTQIAESLTSNTTVTLNDGSCATTRGAVVRIANSMSSVTKSTIVGSEFQSNDTYSAINRGYAGLGTVTVTKPSTGKYVITGAKTPDNAEWKIRSPMTAFGGGLQILVATIESEVGNVITIGVRSVKYTANTTTGAVTVELADYTDIPNDSWVDVHTNLN